MRSATASTIRVPNTTATASSTTGGPKKTRPISSSSRRKLIDQYNAFVPTQLAEKVRRRSQLEAPHVNGALTIGENIGDLSGVNIALSAYAFALDEAAGREKNGSMEAIEASLC